MLPSVLTATLNLLLFRIGPQDFPYDPRLTHWLVPIAVLVNYLVLSLALAPLLAAAVSLAVIMATAFATRLMLRARGLEARFMQTFHALLAVSIVMTLALALPFSEIAPELEKLAAMDPSAVEAAPEIHVAAWAALMMNALNIWNFAVNAHIYRHAAGFGLAGGLLVALIVSLGVLMFVLIFATFVAGLLGGAGPAPG